MLRKKEYKFWFCTGSQDLYGDECLGKVAEHSKKIVEGLNNSGFLPYEVVWKPTLITNELIRKTFNEANLDDPGFWVYRNSENRCFIFIPSLTKSFPTIQSIWIS